MRLVIGRPLSYVTRSALFRQGSGLPKSATLSQPALPQLKSTTIRNLRVAETKLGDVMSSGTIKWFNAQKGYGFIRPDDGSNDVFVHISAVEQAGLRGLNEGQKVNYDIQRGQQGKTSAVNLQAV